MATARRSTILFVAMIGALLLGALVGYALGDRAADLRILGDVFLRLLRTIIPLLIFFTVSGAVAGIAGARRLGRILGAILAVFVTTSIIAASLGVVAGLLLSPGAGVDLRPPADYKPPKPATWQEIVLSFFSLDFAELLSVGGALKLIVFSLIFGIGVSLVGEGGSQIRAFLEAGSRVMVKITELLMYYAPLAVFGYAAWLIGTQGPKIAQGYAKLLLALYLFAILHFLVTYGTLVSLSGIGARKYFREQLEPFMVAFATRSSAATLPVNLRAAERMGIPREVYQVSLPVGATINMDGTAMYQALSALFVAQIFGIALGPDKLILLVFAALIGSIATAAIPGGGLIMLAFVLSAVGLPLEGIGIILAIDPLLDAIRTAINVSGDNASSAFVSRILKASA